MEKNFLSDRIVYALAFVSFFVAGGYLLFSSNDIARNLSDKSAFGSVRPIGKDVRLRGYEEMIWSPVQKTEKVYRNDRVFTGSQSSAEVTLKNKQRFVVEPNSLIKITDQEETSLFNVQNGSFFADLTKGSRFFLQSASGKKTEIKSDGAVVRVESNKDKVKLVVLKGEVMTVVNNKDHTVVKANEEAEIEVEQIKTKTFDIVLKTPAPGAQEWYQGDPVKFTWQTSGPKQVRIDVATEPSFENVIYTQSLSKNETSVSLAAGQIYFWRVSEEGQSQSHSPVSSFALNEVQKPVEQPRQLASIAPLDTPHLHKTEFKFELGGFDKEVSLTYQKAENASENVLELSHYEDFHENILSEKLNEGSWTWSKPQAGLFYARIKASHEKESVYSAVSKVQVIIAAPEFTDLKLVGQPNKPQTMKASFKTYALSRFLEVQVADQADFVAASTKKISSNSFAMLIKQPGTKYIRARSLNKDQWPISRYSGVRSLTIAPLVPEVKPPAVKPEIEKELEPKEKVAVQQQASVNKYKTRFNVWAGLGMNYLSFTQSGDSSSDFGSGSFAKLAIPTYSFGGNVQWSEKQAASFEYHDWPGEVTGPSSVEINNPKYHLLSMSAQYEHRLLKNQTQQIFLLGGYKISQAPFLAVNSSGDNVLLNNEMQSALIGAKMKFFVDQGVEAEASARYYLLTSSKNLNSASFKADFGPMMDATLGISRSYDNGLRFGLYWLLQYQDNKYKFNIDGAETTGNQSFINSNFQLRFGYEFFGLMILPMLAWRRRKKKNN